MSIYCETCKNLNSDICKECRYCDENPHEFYEPVKMNFIDAIKELQKGKVITRDCRHYFTKIQSRFSEIDYLSEDWIVFNEEKSVINLSELLTLEKNERDLRNELSNLSTVLKTHLKNELCISKEEQIKEAYELFLKGFDLKRIKKELKIK